MKAENTRKTSGIKELKGDSGSDIEDNIEGETLYGKEVSPPSSLKQWKAHKPMYVEGDIPSKWNWTWGQQCQSCPPYTMYKEEMTHIQLRKSTVNLKTYTGQRVNPPW